MSDKVATASVTYEYNQKNFDGPLTDEQVRQMMFDNLMDNSEILYESIEVSDAE